MLNYSDFIEKDKSILIAPAGYGKTYSICKCLEIVTKKHLVLTHTNAGVASIREKLKKLNVPSKNYHVETIASYCEKYVSSYGPEDLFPIETTQRYKDLYIAASNLLENKIIQSIIRETYEGVFVDEYQDCSVSQHKFIVSLSKIIKVHILGDPMQAIFNFNDELINWETIKDFGYFYKLDKPQRWLQSGYNELGQNLHNIRNDIDNNTPIVIENYKSIEKWNFSEIDISRMAGSLFSKMQGLSSQQSLLVIYYDSRLYKNRMNLCKKFKWLKNVEPFDKKENFNLAKSIQTLDSSNYYDFFYTHFRDFFMSTEFDEFFSCKGIKSKRDITKEDTIKNILTIKKALDTNFTLELFYAFINYIIIDLKLRAYNDTFYDLQHAIYKSILNKISIEDAMRQIHKIRKIQGRSIQGKYVGTTLLTKGLEFDTVVVLYPHKMNSNNLYVAMTRASKRLILVTDVNELKPWKIS
ncbi:MAG: AAA family ATPase [Azospirillum sp.]|nr:AAA family ATPase [Azospirillum sp.]